MRRHAPDRVLHGTQRADGLRAVRVQPSVSLGSRHGHDRASDGSHHLLAQPRTAAVAGERAGTPPVSLLPWRAQCLAPRDLVGRRVSHSIGARLRAAKRTGSWSRQPLARRSDSTRTRRALVAGRRRRNESRHSPRHCPYLVGGKTAPTDQHVETPDGRATSSSSHVGVRSPRSLQAETRSVKRWEL